MSGLHRRHPCDARAPRPDPRHFQPFAVVVVVVSVRVHDGADAGGSEALGADARFVPLTTQHEVAETDEGGPVSLTGTCWPEVPRMGGGASDVMERAFQGPYL